MARERIDNEERDLGRPDGGFIDEEYFSAENWTGVLEDESEALADSAVAPIVEAVHDIEQKLREAMWASFSKGARDVAIEFITEACGRVRIDKDGSVRLEVVSYEQGELSLDWPLRRTVEYLDNMDLFKAAESGSDEWFENLEALAHEESIADALKIADHLEAMARDIRDGAVKYPAEWGKSK